MSGKPIFRNVRAPKEGTPYYLPRGIFRNVVAFCLSYNDLKRQLKTFTGFHSARQDGMPRGSDLSDPTARDGERLAKIEAKIDIIENAVLRCSGKVLYQYMLLSVTDEGCSWAKLEAQGIPMNRKAWAQLRRKIYYEVAKEI